MSRSAPPDRYVATAADRRALAEGCWWDESAADRVREFFRKFLRHSKGKWAGGPFELLPWQWDDVVRPVFAWKRADETRRFRRAYIEIAKKNGKALDVDTPIPTPAGWSRMGDLSVGDVVFGADGKQCRVIAATEIMCGRPCYRVEFSDHASIVADADHLWRTSCLAREYSESLVSTREIAATMGNRSDGARNHSIALAGSLEIADASLSIPPYVLGFWLGDGHSTSARVTCAHKDTAVLDNIRAYGVTAEERPTTNAGSGAYILGRTCSPKTSICAKLRHLGVLGNKHIPAAYLRASIEQRMELLRGLMDSDGYGSERGQCEFTNTNARLALDAIELIRSLGFKPRCQIGRAMLRGVDCGPKYRITFFAFADRPVFNLARKRARQKDRPARRARSQWRQIIAATPVPSRPVRCIQVSSPDGMYLAGEGMIPTHNSTLCAGLSLCLLVADGEPGAEVYCAAADRDQASIVYHEAASMVRASSELSDHVQVVPSTKRLVFPRTGSFYKALSAEVATKEGLNIHGLIFDELHAQRTRDLWDTLTYGGAAREQPLLIAITTAGWDRHSICWEQHRYAEQVLDGTIEDITFFPYIAAAAEDDDWTDPKVWAKANPSMGVTVNEVEFAEACAEAQASPHKENAFKRYRLNIWTEQDVRWLQMARWDACNGPVDAESLLGRECYAGLDLSSTTDISALSLVFAEDDGFIVLPYFWIPQENARERERRDRVPYITWARDGFIETTPGNVIDYAFIRAKLNELAAKYRILQLGIDPFNARQLAIQLGDDGIEVLEFRQGYLSLSPPTKELEKLVISGKLAHGGHPVLRWMAGNVTVDMDPAGNLKPSKAKSTERIDGIVSTIMGIGLATAAAPSGSVYEANGALTLDALAAQMGIT